MNLIKQNLMNRSWIELSIYSFALFPLLPNMIKGFPVIFLFFATLMAFKYKWDNRGQLKILLNTLPYVLILVGLIYTSNYEYAFKKIETGLSLLIVPLSFWFLSTWRVFKDKDRVLSKFSLYYFVSSVLFAVFSFCFIIDKGLYKYFEDPNFVRHFTQELPLIGQHPIYSSVFLALGILIYIYLGFQSKSRNFRIAGGIGCVILFLLLALLASKGVLIALGTCTLLIILRNVKGRRKKIIAALGGMCIFLFAVLTIPGLSKRVGDMISSLDPSTKIEGQDSTEIRKAVYACSIDSMKNQWFFGHGTGDVGDVLDNCYQKNGYDIYVGRYNSHNQYLNYLLSNGLAGLTIFIVFLAINFYLAFQKRDYFFLSILVFYSIVMLFENLLSRQSGVILFAFLISFLTFIGNTNATPPTSFHKKHD